MEPPFPYMYRDWPRPEVLPFVPANATRILDVGCAYGAFGAALKRADPTREVWGIEPHSPAAEAARGRLDRVIVGSFPHDMPAGVTFDCVTFVDVLEHLVDPWGAVRAARSFLRPGGSVLAVLPNIRNAQVAFELVVRGNWTYRDSGVLDRTHLRFFTRKTAEELFTDAGFDVALVQPLNLGDKTRLMRALARLGKATNDFRALQYLVRARV